MRPGDVSLHPPGLLPGFRLGGETEILEITLEPALIAQAAEQDSGAARIEFVPQLGGPDPQIQRLGLALQAELDNGCPGGRLLGDSLALALALHVLTYFSAFPAPARGCPGGLSRADLRRVLSYVSDHLAEDLSLAVLADVVHLSPSHFKTLFKRSTGVPVHRYVTEQRVERARQLLLHQPGLSVGQIAALVGFYDQAHLTGHLRRMLNVTPAALRRS